MDRVDERAEEMGLNRSAFITVAVNNYFLQEDAMRAMKDMPEFMKKLEEIEKRVVENESKQQQSEAVHLRWVVCAKLYVPHVAYLS